MKTLVDRNMGQVTHWKITGTQTNQALAFDEAGRRLFSGALQPGKLSVVDSDSGRLVTVVRIVVGVDDLWSRRASACQNANRCRYERRA